MEKMLYAYDMHYVSVSLNPNTFKPRLVCVTAGSKKKIACSQLAVLLSSTSYQCAENYVLVLLPSYRAFNL